MSSYPSAVLVRVMPPKVAMAPENLPAGGPELVSNTVQAANHRPMGVDQAALVSVERAHQPQPPPIGSSGFIHHIQRPFKNPVSVSSTEF